MSKVLNMLWVTIFFMLSALVLDLVAFSMLNLGIAPEYFWYNFSIIMVLGIVLLLIPNFKAQLTVALIFLLIQSVLLYTNYSLYIIYGDIFSFDMFFLAKEAMQATNSSFMYTRMIIYILVIYIILCIIGRSALKRCLRTKTTVRDHYTIFIAIVMLSMAVCSSGVLLYDRLYYNKSDMYSFEDYVKTDSFLLDTSYLKAASYSKFGTYGYYANLIINSFPVADNKLKEMTIDYFKSGETYKGTTYDDQSSVFGIDSGNNVILFMLESVEWFGLQNFVKDNEKLCPDFIPNIYSIIYGSDYVTDTENENKDNDSMLATQFFAKSKTNISEGQALMGNYPTAQTLASIAGKKNAKENNVFGYTLPSILHELGYTTTYVHSNTLSFYDRKKTHSNIGFDVVCGKDNIEDFYGERIYTGKDLSWGHWENEGEFAENAIDYIVPENFDSKPFFTFYLNVTSHGGYDSAAKKYDEDAKKYYYYIMYGEDDCVLDANGNYILDPNKTIDDLTETEIYANINNSFFEDDPDLCQELVYYLCGIKGLDDAIGVTLRRLEEYDILDKTTILLFADHYAYYGNLSNRYKRVSLEDPNAKTTLYTIPMILSSPGIKRYNQSNHLKNFYDFREFTSAYDITPTILDLLGIEFNENLYLGDSIFKPNDKFIDPNTTEYVDNKVYYANTGGIYSKDSYTYDMKSFVVQNGELDRDLVIDKFKAEAYKILEKMNYVQLMNKYGLYNKIKKK